MKILHCTAQLPSKTGSGVYFTNLVEGFSDNLTENGLIYGIQEPLTVDFGSQIKQYPVRFLSDALNFPMPGMSDEMPYLSTVYSKMTVRQFDQWIAAYTDALITAKDDFNPDVVIVHHLFYLASLVCDIFSDAKLIGICHGTDLRQINQHPQFMGRGLNKIIKLDRVISLGNDDAKQIEKIFGIASSNITNMGGGYNPKLFNRNYIVNKTKRKIVFAGKISQSKGVFALASTLPLLVKKFPNVELSLIGNAAEDDLIKLNELADHHKGFSVYNVENQKILSEHIKQADIFVLPSYYEGFGLVAIEALACGLRVVSTEIDNLMFALGEEVNCSGMIEYVKLPRIYDIDKPVEEDIPSYIDRLAKAIEKQLIRLDCNDQVDDKVYKLIEKHSWTENIRIIKGLL